MRAGEGVRAGGGKGSRRHDLGSAISFCGARGACSRLPRGVPGGRGSRPPPKRRGGRRAVRRSLSFQCAPLVVGETRRLSARRPASFTAPGRALPVVRSIREAGSTVSELLAGTRSGPGRSPGAARVRGLRDHARGRRPAPHEPAQPVRAPHGERARGNMVLDYGGIMSYRDHLFAGQVVRHVARMPCSRLALLGCLCPRLWVTLSTSCNKHGHGCDDAVEKALQRTQCPGDGRGDCRSGLRCWHFHPSRRRTIRQASIRQPMEK